MLEVGEIINEKIKCIKDLEFPLVGARHLKMNDLYWVEISGRFNALFEKPTSSGDSYYISVGIDRDYVYERHIDEIYDHIHRCLLNLLDMDIDILDTPLHKAIYGE